MNGLSDKVRDLERKVREIKAAQARGRDSSEIVHSTKITVPPSRDVDPPVIFLRVKNPASLVLSGYVATPSRNWVDALRPVWVGGKPGLLQFDYGVDEPETYYLTSNQPILGWDVKSGRWRQAT